MAFDTPIPLGLVLIAALVLVCLALWLAWRAREALPRRYLGTLLALRLLTIVCTALLAVNPYVTKERPDPDGVRVAVLTDVSGSMATPDTGGQPRLETLRQILSPNSADSLQGQLEADFNVSTFSFVDSLMADTQGLEQQAGNSALGETLQELLDSRNNASRLLASVVLLSDGISLQGEDPLEVAKRYREAGVPVSTIGTGSARTLSNLSLNFQKPPRKAPVGDVLALELVASNETQIRVEAEIELYAGETLVETQQVQIPAQSETTLLFETNPDIAGFQTYRARLRESPVQDFNPADDVAYAAVEITPPDTLEVLYLSNRVDQTFRFLQQSLRQDDQFTLRALIRLGENKFLQQGFEDAEVLPQTRFPDDPKVYLKNRVLIVDTSVLPELETSALEAMRTFLEERAGGILFLGPPELAQEQMAGLIPVRQTDLVEVLRREPIQLGLDPIFGEAAGGLLFMPPGPYLPKETPASTAIELARGARVVASTEYGDLPILTIQAYGAGRTAYLGTESTWRWQMASDRGGSQYRLFWRYLLGWLGAGSKPRLDSTNKDTIRNVGEPASIDLRVLGRDFRPSPNAKIRARIQGPDGQSLSAVTLTPSPYEPGLYNGVALPELPGEYRVNYQVQFSDGETLSRQDFFAATRQGRENEEIIFQKQLLQDIARITGGLYADYDNFLDILPLKLAAGLPMLEERIYWTRNSFFLVLILTMAGLEWFLRRRVGLR